MSCIAVSDNYLAISKGLHIDCYNQAKKHTFFNVPSKPMEGEIDCITEIIISSDSKYLATVTSSKQLILCRLPFTTEVKTFALPRNASKIRFSASNSQILVADKSGDVLIYDLNTEESGKKLLGHLSLLLDVLQTPDEKYILTSDRDEKIRVSYYPNTYNIKTYCLGHKEFVNHMEILPHNTKYLTSSSGDGTIKCWDYVNGALAYNINTYLDVDDGRLKDTFTKCMDEEGVEVDALPIVHYTVTSLNQECSLLAVAVHGYNQLLIYSLETKDNTFIHKKEESLRMEKFPTAIKFHKHYLYLYDDGAAMVTKHKIVIDGKKISFEFDEKIQMFDSQDIDFEAKTSLEIIKVLYKRKFDNMQEYQQRKKLRLDKSSQ